MKSTGKSPASGQESSLTPADVGRPVIEIVRGEGSIGIIGMGAPSRRHATTNPNSGTLDMPRITVARLAHPLKISSPLRDMFTT
jgi:hypothetical protein